MPKKKRSNLSIDDDFLIGLGVPCGSDAAMEDAVGWCRMA
jgi:hypothetical protein